MAATFNGNMTLGDAQTDTITVKGKFANQSTTGTASFNGDVNLGNASGDVIKVKGVLGSDITPKTGERHDLGTTSSRYHQIFANTLFANTIATDNNLTVGGDLTVSGTTSLASGQTFSSRSVALQTSSQQLLLILKVTQTSVMRQPTDLRLQHL